MSVAISRAIVLAACLGFAVANPIAAAEFPKLIHGEAEEGTHSLSSVFEVTSQLGQIRLSPTLVAAARVGTVFEVYAPLAGSSAFLRVARGQVSLVDEQKDIVQTVAAGGRLAYDTAPVPPAATSVDHPTETGETNTRVAPPELAAATAQLQLQESRQGFQLSDSVMTRQQEYLSSLKIDIIDLNRVVASFIRRLLLR